VTASEVEWVLDQLTTAVNAIQNNYTLSDGDPVTVKRVDRDESRLYTGSDSVDMSTPIRSRTGELKTGVFVGASLVDRSPTAVGTEYDHELETVVGLRVEGLHYAEWGHVDPDGDAGVPFNVLISEVRDALLKQRTYPAAGGSGVSYTDLQLQNEADTSSNWKDFYRHSVDVVFNGFETLP
jgi:hypothetical protein